MAAILDSHAHLDFDAFAPDFEAVVQRAAEAGVRVAMVPGFERAQWGRAAEVAMRVGAHRAYGVHPFALSRLNGTTWEETWRALTRACEGHGPEGPAAAVGETGLDARLEKVLVPFGRVDRDAQERSLTAHLELAARLRLPVILHCVGAHGRLLEILRAVGPLEAGGVLHAYSGSAELVPVYASLGLSFGFGGAVTHPRATKLHRALRAVPDDRLLLETDAPDMPPQDVTGRRNEPSFLPRIAVELARLRSQTMSSLTAHATANTLRLFGPLPEPVPVVPER